MYITEAESSILIILLPVIIIIIRPLISVIRVVVETAVISPLLPWPHCAIVLCA